MYACPKQSSQGSSKKENMIKVLQKSTTKTNSKYSLHQARINHQSWQQEASDPPLISEKASVSSRQREMKLQRKE